jgi:hypothetical protein
MNASSLCHWEITSRAKPMMGPSLQWNLLSSSRSGPGGLPFGSDIRLTQLNGVLALKLPVPVPSHVSPKR